MRALVSGILVLFLSIAASPALSADLAGLEKAQNEPGAVASVFFVEGMTCRACTTILDKKIAKIPGVFWSRFNFPLRLLTVYHDPKTAPRDKISGLVNDSGKLRAVFLRDRPASEPKPIKRVSLAEWKGGSVMLCDVVGILNPFKESLKALLGDSPEIHQVRYEALGEHVRNKIILEAAKKAGYARKGEVKDLPQVIAKDFFWPDNLRPLTPDEQTIAGFVEEKVLKQNPEKAEDLFDAWLLGLWRSTDFKFYGEFAEEKL